jgi:DNA modification methylase
MVADNKLGELSETDMSMVNFDVMDLGPDFDTDLLGIPGFQIELADKLEPQCDENEIPENVEPRTKPGDLYQLGRHRLMCGDSTSIDAVQKLMEEANADMVFTDPPYGVEYRNNMSKRFEVIENDDKILSIAPVVWSVMKDNTSAFIWTSQSVYPQWREQFSEFYKSTIIWAKGGGGMGDLKGDFAPNYEMALFCTKGRPSFIGKRPMAVWEIGKDAASEYVHPTQKPVALAEYAIDLMCNKNDVVLDLFGGSGSTMIACEKSGRTARLMELDPKYCDVIVARWEKYTGQKAELLQSVADGDSETDQAQLETIS